MTFLESRRRRLRRTCGGRRLREGNIARNPWKLPRRWLTHESFKFNSVPFAVQPYFGNGRKKETERGIDESHISISCFSWASCSQRYLIFIANGDSEVRPRYQVGRSFVSLSIEPAIYLADSHLPSFLLSFLSWIKYQRSSLHVPSVANRTAASSADILQMALAD